MKPKSSSAIVASAESAIKRMARYKQRAAAEQSRMVQTAELLAGNTLAGALDGMYAETDADSWELMGLPGNAVVGGVGTLVTLVGGRQIPFSEHLLPIFTGILGGYVYTEGRTRAKG